MKNAWNHLKKVLRTVYDEPRYILEALKKRDDGPSVSLPIYYWRFYLLWPFVKDPQESRSPFVRNFCPLFHMTNVLLILWLAIGIWLLAIFGMVIAGMALIDVLKDRFGGWRNKRSLKVQTCEIQTFSPENASVLKDMLDDYNVIHGFLSFWVSARQDQGLPNPKALTKELILLHSQLDLEELTALDQELIKEKVIDEFTRTSFSYRQSQYYIATCQALLFIATTGAQSEEAVNKLIITYEQEILPQRQKAEAEREEREKWKKEKQALWAAKREKFLTTTYVQGGKLFETLKPVGSAFVVILGALTLLAAIGAFVYYLPSILGGMAWLLSCVLSSGIFSMAAYMIGVVLGGMFTLWVVSQVLMRFEDSFEKAFKWMDKTFPAKPSTLTHLTQQKWVTPCDNAVTKVLLWVVCNMLIRPLERVIDGIVTLVEIVGPVAILPFSMIRMFFSKNCPAIQLTKDDDTGGSKPADS